MKSNASDDFGRFPTFPGQTINGYAATSGWDPVTGWGSPNAQALIPLLAAGGD